MSGRVFVLAVCVFLLNGCGGGDPDGGDVSERVVQISREFRTFCRRLETLRTYVEVNGQRFGGEGCRLIQAASVTKAVLLETNGAYVRLRLTNRDGQDVEGWMEVSSLR